MNTFLLCNQFLPDTRTRLNKQTSNATLQEESRVPPHIAMISNAHDGGVVVPVTIPAIMWSGCCCDAVMWSCSDIDLNWCGDITVIMIVMFARAVT